MQNSTAVTTTQNTEPRDSDGEVRVATECYTGSCDLDHAIYTNPDNPDVKPLVFEEVSAHFREPMFDDTAKELEVVASTFSAADDIMLKGKHYARVGFRQSRTPGQYGSARRVHRTANIFIPAQDLVTLRDALTKEIRSARRKGLIS